MMDTRYDVLMTGTRKDSYIGSVKISAACNSASVLVRCGGKATVVDTGAMGYGDELLSSLDALHVDPKDIDAVINTHSHQDHVFNNHLFSCPIYTPSSVWYPDDGNRIEIYGDITGLDIPCVSVMNTPGHMLGHISAVFESDSKKVVVSGDAIRESVIRDGQIHSRYDDPQAYLSSMNSIFGLADIIIPGHGRVIEGELLEELSCLALKVKIV